MERLREAIETLVPAAYHQDEAEEAALGSRRGDARPAELARREERVAPIEEARRRWEAQAKREADAERHRRAAGDAERQRTGQTRQGKVPKAVDEPPADTAQTHCTDPELGSMRTHHKGWAYCGKAQARVAGACQIILARDVVHEANDTQPATPLAEATRAHLAQAGIEGPNDESGAVPSSPATLANGYDSEVAVAALEPCGFDPSSATGRQRHQAPQGEPPGEWPPFI